MDSGDRAQGAYVSSVRTCSFDSASSGPSERLKPEEWLLILQSPIANMVGGEGMSSPGGNPSGYSSSVIAYLQTFQLPRDSAISYCREAAASLILSSYIN